MQPRRDRRDAGDDSAGVAVAPDPEYRVHFNSHRMRCWFSDPLSLRDAALTAMVMMERPDIYWDVEIRSHSVGCAL